MRNKGYLMRAVARKQEERIHDSNCRGLLWRRRGQVAETMTWTVATVVILVLTFIFLFFTQTLATSKGVHFQSVITPTFQSDVETQQMLFAVLASMPASGTKTLKELLLAGDYAAAREAAGAVLQTFAAQSIDCRFRVYSQEQRGALLNVGEGAADTSSTVILGGKEVTLQCSA